MKYLYCSIIFLVLACCPATAHAGNDNDVSYLSQIVILDQEVVKINRNVELKMLVDLSQLKLRSQHTIALTPVIVSADGSRETALPPVVIDGKTRNKVYLRAQTLKSVELPPYHDDNAQVIISRRNGSEQSYDYSASLPYERWMLDGRIELREQVHGCANCAEGASQQAIPGNILATFVPNYRLDTIAPEPEPVKVRAETRTARLQFMQGKYDILPRYKNNRAELDTVSSSIELVKKNTDVSITGIYITGYASPEGTVPDNIKLSENRAKALADYIRRNSAISANMLHVDWKGEDWDGLRLALNDFPGLLKRDEVWRIIDECTGDRDLCEMRLKELQPPAIYQRLLDEVYPILRRNEYRIEYNVRSFNLDEARRTIRERPDLLSLSEMYRVADSYPKGSPEYNRAMAAAMRYFPETPAVLNDRATEAIANKDYRKAIELLERAKVTAKTPVLLNTLGVAYAGAKDYDKAENAFRRASDAGSETARHNLGELRAVMDQL